MKRTLAPGTGRIIARLAVGVMAVAVAGLGGAAVWAAVAMQDGATALARGGAQTGGQLRALQSLSTIRIELSVLGDDGPSPGPLAAVRDARASLPVALNEMEHGDIRQAAAVARQAEPLARKLDTAVERYLNDPKGDILYPTLTIERLTREFGRAPTDAEIDANSNGDDDTSRDTMSTILTDLELMLNGKGVNASQELTGMLGGVTRSERNIWVIAWVLVPLGLLGAAASAWLLTVLRRRSDEQDQAGRDRLETVLVGLPSPVIVTDETGAVVSANPAAEELVGSVRALADLDMRDADGAPVDLPSLANSARASGRRTEPRDVTLTRPDGTVGQVTLEVVPLAEQDGQAPHVVVALADITAQRLYEEHLHYRAYHDGLTGLPNRAMLWQRIDAAVTNAVPYVLLLIDLDRFKAVNDTLGHHIGDELLQAVGGRLRAAASEQATVARLGGDEFAILLCDADLSDAASVAAAVRGCFADPFVLSCGPVQGSGSVGFAVAESGQSPDQVMQVADQQMYRSKPRSRQQARTKAAKTPTAT